MVNISNQTPLTVLKNSPWFQGLPDDSLTWLASCSSIISYERNESIYQSGDHRNSVFGVVDGIVNVSFVGDGDQKFQITKFYKGTWFGESALLDHFSKVIDITPIEPTLIIKVPTKEVKFIAEQYPIVYKNLYFTKLRQTQLIYDMFTSVLTYPLQARIALRLLTVLDARGIEMNQGKCLSPALTIVELAELALGSVQRVTMIVNEWFDKGYIIINADTWIIPDSLIFEELAAS